MPPRPDDRPGTTVATPRPGDRPGTTRTTPRLLVIAAALFLAGRIALGVIEKPSGPEHAAVPDSTELVAWVPPDSAVSIAQATGKPILYDFAAEWCGPCNAMKKEMFSEAESAAFINGTFVPSRVLDRAVEDGTNPPEVAALQETYRIRAFPTLVVVAGDRAPVFLEGYAGSRETIEKLRDAAGSP